MEETAGSSTSGSPVRAARSSPPSLMSADHAALAVSETMKPVTSAANVGIRDLAPARLMLCVIGCMTLSFLQRVGLTGLIADEIEERSVERVGGFPEAGMAAGRRRPLRPGDRLLQLPGEANRDEDVLLTREHQGRHLDGVHAADRVVLLNDRELRQIGFKRHVE